MYLEEYFALFRLLFFYRNFYPDKKLVNTFFVDKIRFFYFFCNLHFSRDVVIFLYNLQTIIIRTSFVLVFYLYFNSQLNYSKLFLKILSYFLCLSLTKQFVEGILLGISVLFCFLLQLLY